MVKFEVYNIIRQLYISLPIKNYYQKSVDENYFNYLGRLKYGYALLAHYLQSPIAITNYSIDKLLTSKDFKQLDPTWSGHDFYEHLDDLGNFIVLDCSKKNKVYSEKRRYYGNTSVKQVRDYLATHPVVTYEDLAVRTSELKQVLNNFFKDPKND